MWQLPLFGVLGWIFMQAMEHQHAGFREDWFYYTTDPVILARTLLFFILLMGCWRLPLSRRFENEPLRNKITAVLETGLVCALIFRVLMPEVDPLTRTASFIAISLVCGGLRVQALFGGQFYRGEKLTLKSPLQATHAMRVYLVVWFVVAILMLTTSSFLAVLFGAVFWTFAPTTHLRNGRIFESLDCRAGFAGMAFLAYFLLAYTVTVILADLG